jgi:hypothetical protein
VLRESGLRRITLSSCILAQDESSASIADAIIKEFKHGAALISQWRAATDLLYPDRPDLLSKLPLAKDLSMAKLGMDSFTTIDTCNGAQKIRRILNEQIKKVAKESGLSEDQIKTFEADCWQHLRNAWFGAVSNELENKLREILRDDLKELPAIYRIDLGIEDLCRCVEKVFGLNANYAKGYGSEFEPWANEYHDGVYLYPLTRACGGTRQDLAVEGAPAILMNLPYYLQFLHWRLSATGGKGDSISLTKLFIMLRSTKVVALLRILSILYISVCLPTCWLAGKTHELSKYNFGYYDMITC